MPKGDKYSPKQKDRTTTNFKVYKEVFNWYLLMKYLKEDFSNWYLKYLVFFQLVKPSSTLRGDFHPGGVLCKSKEKAFETRGENFKSWKCFSKSYSYTFYYLQKDFENIFPKEFAKRKLVVEMWSKILKERKQSMHI
jgi:hypothetical protein